MARWGGPSLASPHEVTFPRGEKIIETGQPLDSLFLIKKGVVSARGTILCKGKMFGEAPPMPHRPLWAPKPSPKVNPDASG
jgi:hypothetical protein